MGARVLIAGLCVLVALGCSKRPKKPAPATDNPPPSSAPPSAADNKKAKDDEPNWLTDPRFKKDGSEPGAPKGPTATGKSNWGLSAPTGGWQGDAKGDGKDKGDAKAPPPVAPPALTPGGNTPLGAAGRVVGQNEMREVWLFIENTSGATGQMPKPSAIYEALVAAKSPAAGHVKDGAIVLTGATQREGVWAYEARALTGGGLAVTQSGVERLTADELKQRLGK